MTACFETFNEERFCSFPHRHCDGTTEASDSRRDMLHGASKLAFRARLPYISHFAASKSTFSYKFSYEPTSKSTFRAKLPSIFITCHKMPRLPRNLHVVTTSRSADNAIRRKHTTRHVYSVASAAKNAAHLLKTSQKYCACHTKPRLTRLETCWNVTKCHACHAK